MNQSCSLKAMRNSFTVTLMFILMTLFGMAGPALGQPPHRDRPTLLLRTLTQDELSGEYRTKDSSVRFHVAFTRNKDIKKSDWFLYLERSTGERILEVRFNPATGKGLTSLNQGHVQFLQEVKQGRRTIIPKAGKPADAITYFKTPGPELKLIVPLAFELSRGAGVNAKTHSISIPIYELAVFLARMDRQGTRQTLKMMHLEDIPMEEPEQPDTPIQGGSGCTGCCVAYSLLDDPSCKDMREGTCAANCKGMCGLGSWCAEIICGDCCCHKGCLIHDEHCRTCRWDNPDPFECLACGFFWPWPGIGESEYCKHCDWKQVTNAQTGTQTGTQAPGGGTFDCTKLHCDPKKGLKCCSVDGCIPIMENCTVEQ